MAPIKYFFDNVYLASILWIAVILFLLKRLQFVFGNPPPLMLFLVLIAFAAKRGGVRAGLFSTVLGSAASAYFLFEPLASIAIVRANQILHVMILASVGAILSVFIVWLHSREKRILRQVVEREEQLKQEIAERDRMKAERDLYVSLAKSSIEFVGMCDTEYVPFFINDAGLRLVGLDSLAQGLKTPVKEFFFPEDQSVVMEEFFPEVVRNGRGEIEIRFRHFKSGEAIWVICNIFALKNLNGKIIGFSTVSTDITVRKRAEEALRQSQKDLNHAQAVAHIGNWRLDVRNNRLEWSDENFRIFGVPKGTPLTYQLFLDLILPVDRSRVDAAWQEALTGKPYDIEHRILVDGKVKWVREQAELEFDGQGTLLGGFGTAEDITDIKSNQEALRRKRVFLRKIIDAVPSMIFVKDREGRFLLGNAALAKCYGINTQDLVGLTDDSLSPNADEVARFHRDDLDVISQRKPKRIHEEQVTHADGSIHWYSTVKTPLIDDDGGCNKLLGVATDITELKQTEATLLEAGRRKDEFLAMLAHELRNPLAPIRNAVELLKIQEPTDPKLAWSYNVIDRQVTHMASLLDDLLDTARIMQGKITLKVERFELIDIVNMAIENTQPLIDSRRQELTVLQKAPQQWIEGDRVRLTQVLSNLLNNAAKYTAESSQITLCVRKDDSDVVIEVFDTGIGIPPDILPQIFDLFIQADHSLDRSQGGLGIGLTLVRRLVEMHGGTVSAASGGIGQGSLFTVRLPALSVNPSTDKPTLAEGNTPMTKLRILIVDDYPDAAESLMMLLQLKGNKVEIADCGMKALERAQIFQPQLVLIDIGLPDLNGYEVAKRMRMLPETRDAVLVSLTGYGQSEDLELSQSAGFNHHLLKPLDFEKLSALLPSSEKSH